MAISSLRCLQLLILFSNLLVNYGCNSNSAVTANGTYFSSYLVSSGFSGQCQLKYCTDSDVCQIRLDFENFVINGPYSDPLAGEILDIFIKL